MGRCDAPVRQCFQWHIMAKGRKVRHRKRDDGTDDPYSVRMLCPAHPDTEQSLGISVDGNRIKWHCFACDNGPKVRLALIREYGIDSGCLPLPAKEKQDVLDFLAELLAADTISHAEIRLRALAAVEGYRDLPQGLELERLARIAHVSRGKAYEFRGRSGPVQNH